MGVFYDMLQYPVMEKGKKIVIANWKMNPQTFSAAKRLFLGIKKKAVTLRNVETVIAPPFVFLSSLSKLYSSRRMALSGQDVFWEKKGLFTGEVSTSQLKESGADYVIVGHSERRALGETNDMVHRKVKAVIKEGLTAIVCIGESEHDSHGAYLKFLREQLESALVKIKAGNLKNIIIAYEPLWAIGKTNDEAITPEKLHETILFIRRVLIEMYNKDIAFNTRIIYGGSVERGNAHALLIQGTAQGFLVGHASLDALEFGDILDIANQVIEH